MLVFTLSLNALVMLLGPVVLGILLNRRLGLRWGVFLAGVATFVGSQVVHIPLNTLVKGMFSSGMVPPAPEAWQVWLTPLAFGLSAGVCEETARYVCFRWFLPKERTFRDGLMHGAGHGGVEAMILGLLAGIGFISMFAASSMDLTGQVPADQLEALTAQVEGYWSTPLWMSVMGAWERVMAVTCHIAMSVMVARCLFTGRLRWFVAAIAFHTALDFFAVYVLLQAESLGLEREAMFVTIEGIATIFGIVALGTIVVLRTSPSSVTLGAPPLKRVLIRQPLDASDLDDTRFATGDSD